jgi:Glycosyl transferase family 2
VAVFQSRFPATPKPKLIYDPDAGNMALTGGLNVEPTLRRLTADVEIVIPVYNEEQELALSVRRLHDYLTHNFPLSWLITVADNASTDYTWAIACGLAQELDGVRALHLGQKGRGRALRAAWLQSSATVVAYMDVDLSTDLGALLPLVAPLLSGHSDVAIGSRLARGARVVRGPKRELISRMYNLLLRATLRNSFSDAQCGFKAMRTEAARQVVPLVEDNAWFFDTELLVLAERNGLRIHEVAVDWVDDPGSTVDLVRTARDDLKGIARIMFGPAPGRLAIDPSSPVPTSSRRPQPSPAGGLVHFAGAAIVTTVSFALLFALLYGAVGAVGADVVAFLLCVLGNFAINRQAAPGPQRLGPGAGYYATRLLWALLPLSLTLLALAATSAGGVTGLPVLIVVLTAAYLSSALARVYFQYFLGQSRESAR